MSKTLEKVRAKPYVQHVDDERDIDNGIIVTLVRPYNFTAAPGCSVRGFDTASEALAGTTQSEVYRT